MFLLADVSAQGPSFSKIPVLLRLGTPVLSVPDICEASTPLTVAATPAVAAVPGDKPAYKEEPSYKDKPAYGKNS
jgi:hypothetical protein